MTLTTYPMQDNFETKLSQAWNGGTGTVYVQAAPSFTMPAGTFCVVTVDPGTDKEQAFIMDSFSVANKTLNCQSIAVDKGPGLAYTQKTHSVGAKVIISDNYRHWKKIVDELTVTATTDGANVFTGTIGFSGTSNVGLTVKSLTTTQRDALSPSNGAIIYNTTAGEFQVYQSSAWATLASGSTQPNASTTVAGKVEAPTQTEVEQLATTGGTGALVFVTPTTINPNSITVATPASGDKISFSDVNDNNYLKSTTFSSVINTFGLPSNMFGDGSDGAIGSGALTITGSNNTYILKQYTTFAPGTNTVTITPTNCILHIKVQGDCNLTGTTFSFSGKGGQGGAGASSGNETSGDNGGDGNGTGSCVLGGGGGGKTPTRAPLVSVNVASGLIQAGCGSGGGGGFYSSLYSGSGGGGGAGGGCLILEVGGNLTFSSTTMTFTGTNGGNGGNQGGGGGGGGGNIYILYKGTLTGSPTTSLSGGSGGTGSNRSGGCGGNSITTTGSLNNGSAGGAGGNGLYYIAKV